MLIADKWKDYELIDAGDGEKLERWDSIVLQRPDPQAIWPKGEWDRPAGHYIRSSEGGGHWQKYAAFPKEWLIRYTTPAGDIKLNIEPTGFKHTGVFPEQAVNWDFMSDMITASASKGNKLKILNLFAYTGAATSVCALSGAEEVVHVDASKGMNEKAKRNASLSGLSERYIRFITEDVNKFVDREIRRGRKYDGVIMDPPSYGRGPGGELWKLEDELFRMVDKCCILLSETPLFFIINSYTSGYAPSVLKNILNLTITSKYGGIAASDELGLRASARDIVLPCGSTGRWMSGHDL